MKSFNELRRQSAIDELLSGGWLKHLQWVPQVDSTNNLAKLYIQGTEARQMPALFVADRQTTGRGRSGNTWWSPEGCLMFTLVIDASELPGDPARYPQLALVIGLALAETADHFLGEQSGQLKWPNDVYVANRKLAGILIESMQSAQQPIVLAIGVGINTDVDWRQAPPAIREQAVCLSSACGQQTHRESVLLEFMRRVEIHLQCWREDLDYWRDPWRQRSLLQGRIVTARVGDDLVVGRCDDLDDLGRLLLHGENGLHTISAAQILTWI